MVVMNLSVPNLPLSTWVRGVHSDRCQAHWAAGTIALPSRPHSSLLSELTSVGKFAMLTAVEVPLV